MTDLEAKNAPLVTLALLTTALFLTPTALADGWLVNVEDNLVTGTNLEFGRNVLGGQGDTVDIGIANTQCTDEEDVVDVSLLNNEGQRYDTRTGEPCQNSECHGGGTVFDANGINAFQGFEECGFDSTDACQNEHGHWWGLDPLVEAAINAVLADPQTHEPGTPDGHSPRCSDDSDAVDVGILNVEGQEEFQEFCYYEGSDGYTFERSGDRRDGVDVGVANREYCDQKDADDVGIFNCEYEDRKDGLDIGVGNIESIADHDDTLDVNVAGWEMGDGPDGNGVNVLPGFLVAELCYAHFDITRPPTGVGIPLPGPADPLPGR